jgi:hypothetical protein
VFYGDDYDCGHLPPHCILIKELLEFSRDFSTRLCHEEVELMFRYDGVFITLPADQQLVLPVAIGCCTIPLAREESNSLQLMKRIDTVSTILDDTGSLVHNHKKLYLGELGYFGRHYE